MIKTKTLTAVLIALLLVVMLNIAEKFFAETIVGIFSFPAAMLSSLFFGSPVVKSGPLTYTLICSNITINIVESCSGYNFWTVLLSFFTYRMLAGFPVKKTLTGILILIPASYMIAVFINTVRIIAVAYIKIFSSSIISPKYADVMHLWAGVIIFLSSLILMQIIFQRRINHGS